MSNIDGLASKWLELKKAERKLIAERHAIEEQITEALEAKDEGSITHKARRSQGDTVTECDAQT